MGEGNKPTGEDIPKCPHHEVPLQKETVQSKDTDYGYYYRCPVKGCGWTYFIPRKSK